LNFLAPVGQVMSLRVTLVFPISAPYDPKLCCYDVQPNQAKTVWKYQRNEKNWLDHVRYVLELWKCTRLVLELKKWCWNLSNCMLFQLNMSNVNKRTYKMCSKLNYLLRVKLKGYFLKHARFLTTLYIHTVCTYGV
jgi:hypothetical protein